VSLYYTQKYWERELIELDLHERTSWVKLVGLGYPRYPRYPWYPRLLESRKTTYHDRDLYRYLYHQGRDLKEWNIYILRKWAPLQWITRIVIYWDTWCSEDLGTSVPNTLTLGSARYGLNIRIMDVWLLYIL